MFAFAIRVGMLMMVLSRLAVAEGPKVFIESISQPHQEDSILFRGKSTTEGRMPSPSAIQRVLAGRCDACVFVTKKDRADYILTFSNPGIGYEWAVIDNAGDGKTLASKNVILEGNAYANAIDVVKTDWVKKHGPEVKIIKWELPENAEGVYEIKVSPAEVGNGATVRLKVIKL